MKIIVTHTSPDWDAITSVWLIKRYLHGWEEATVQFVPAGESLKNSPPEETIDKSGENEIIHVDTGLGPLDHHQTDEQTVSAASLAWDYVRSKSNDMKEPLSQHMEDKVQAISRIVSIVVATDHFKEVFWADPSADYHEFSLLGLLEGIKFQKPGDDSFYIEYGMECLDALLHTFENRIWAEKEIEKGITFETKWGKGLGFETINDTVLKLAQKMGYVVVIRKDPRKGYVRIKGRPQEVPLATRHAPNKEVDLTLVHEKLKKMDPEATWFLHASKKMLLNGTPKNPKMVASKLSLRDIIEVLKSI